MSKIDIIIPVRNEEKNVQDMALRIFNAMKIVKDSYKMIFVVDTSTDQTLDRLYEISSIYSNLVIQLKKGKPGKAYSIIEAAELSTADYLVMIDGDLQYPPELLPEMIETAKKNGVSVAKRVKHNTSKLRELLSKANNLLFGRLLLGLKCDVQSGFKVFKREIFTHLNTSEIKPWAFDMPLLYTALDLGYEIGEVEIDFAERNQGKSKVSFFSTTSQIISTALKIKFAPDKIYTHHDDTSTVLGRGLSYKRKKFITHTALPHDISALVTFTKGQKIFLTTIIMLILFGLLIKPNIVVIGFIGLLTYIYFLDMLFSVYVLIKSLHFPPEVTFTTDELSSIDDSKLPKYTILVPMYREGEVLSELIRNIDLLDWPKDKLEVLLLLEEDDLDTQNAANNLNLPEYMRVMVVPHSMPKTKPKACNYGLAHSTGEYVVIYDAEDKPDPLQLKKVHLGFEKLPDNVICLQSKLNYFNPNQNWLTRLFTAEYSLWFDIILPGLQSIESTIPLGGTSNHFKTEALKKLHGWDAFNVTEDCDLGARIFKSGYKTSIVDSTTLEEANSNLKNWIRQRSRWIKGYLQTYLVHMRNPISFFASHGIHAFTFQLIIGMRISFMVINPVLWITTFAYFAAYKYVGPSIEALYPAWIFYVAVLTLIFGNFLYIYNYMIGCAKRGHYELIKFVFLVPVYWIMNSIAAFIAFYQLIVKPHYWEKTNHGLHLNKPKSTPTAIKITIETDENRQRVRDFANVYGLTGGVLLIIATVFANVFNLIYSAYLGRTLNIEEFGLIAVIGSIFSISSIATSSVGRSVTYKSAYLFGKNRNIAKNFWSNVRLKSFVAGMAILLLWIALTPVFTLTFKSDSILPFVLFMPVWPILFMTSVDQGFLRGNIKFNLLAVLVLAETFIKLVSAVIIINLDYSEFVYLSPSIGLATSFVLGWYFISNIKVGEDLNKIENTEIDFPKFIFGTSILTKFAVVFFLGADVILAKYFLSPTLAGQYALLSIAGKIVFFVGSLFSEFVDPIISKRIGENKDSLNLFYAILTLIALSSYTGFVFVGLLGNIFLPIVFGEKILLIADYLPVYSLGMASFAIALSIVNYHQLKNNIYFPILAFTTAITEILLIFRFGRDLESFTNIVGFLGVTLLIVVLLSHFIAIYMSVIFRNTLDLMGLFKKIGQTKHESGYLNILMLNWRDTKHSWAGGSEEYVQKIAESWVKEGHSVTIFCGNDGKSKRNEKINGVSIIRRGGFYTVYMWAFLYYILKFRKKFDVIIESVNGVPFFTPLYSNVQKYLITYHVHQGVFQAHLSFPLNYIARFTESVLMPLIYKNTKIFTVSESSKKELEQQLGFDRRKIFIVKPGIDSNILGRVRKSIDPSFVYIGRHKQYKNIENIIEAFNLFQLSYPNSTLNIAGEGEITDKLVKLTRDLGLENKVKFHGFISDQKKKELFGSAWAALQVSSFEGWGITVIEANATRTPVIATNVSGLKDSVVHGRTGILVKPGDVNAIADAMKLISESSLLREELSKNAYNWAKNFDWDKSGKIMMNIIRDELAVKLGYQYATI